MAHVSPAPDTSGPPPDKEAARPTSIGRYLVLNLVGKGAMGEVYAAYDPELDRKVAIKLLRGKPGNDVEAAEGRLRMMREAQSIAKLSHPNVVVVYDVGAFQDQVFVAMEFVDGHTVWYWMNAQRRAWADVLKIFSDAGRGLAAAHDKGLVHRDFKPENVMLSADGQVRVMDFGLARTIGASPRSGATVSGTQSEQVQPMRVFIPEDTDIDSTRAIGASFGPAQTAMESPGGSPQLYLTQTGAILGTPAYMAPEQFRGGATDARTDQFSFCVAVYEALYGERPFAGKTPQALESSVLKGLVRPAPPETDVPEWVRKLLLRGLKPSPDDRWPSMNALLAELDKHGLFAQRRQFAESASEKLRDIWQAPVRGQPVESKARGEVRAAFLATKKTYAATAFQGVTEILDRYATDWSKMYTDICEATHVRGEQSVELMDLRMACLMELLDGLRALCQIFRQADADVVENAVNAATALGGIERCADVKFLRAVVRPPEDLAARAAVEVLRSRLTEVRALCNVGRLDEGLKMLAPIQQEAHQIGYVPLLAETFLALGRFHAERRNVDKGVVAFEEAVWGAELCRHDEVAAEATTYLIYMGESELRFDVSEVWARHAETVLRRLGGNHPLWGWLFNNRGALRERQGRLNDALEDARRAVAVKEKTGDPDRPDVALSLGNLAMYLTQMDRSEEALPYIEKAVRIVNKALGPEHPRSAIVQYNYVEILNALGRFAEARTLCASVFTTFEREVGFGELTLTYPMLAMGLALLGDGRPDDARPLLERATAICDAKETDPVRLGDVRFALARALVDADPRRAHELAARAREDYLRASRRPAVDRELVKVTNWLAAH